MNKMRESELCQFRAEYAIRQRRKVEDESAINRGSVRLSAMLAESKVVDELLGPLKLTHTEKLEYVSNNSVFIRSGDEQEAIQLVWAPEHAICIHRLLSKEFREEFQAHWLGVWTEPLRETPKELLVDVMRLKVAHREEQRKVFGVNGEFPFAASPSMVETLYEFRS